MFYKVDIFKMNHREYSIYPNKKIALSAIFKVFL
jgi:hypothetical protein